MCAILYYGASWTGQRVLFLSAAHDALAFLSASAACPWRSCRQSRLKCIAGLRSAGQPRPPARMPASAAGPPNTPLSACVRERSVSFHSVSSGAVPAAPHNAPRRQSGKSCRGADSLWDAARGRGAPNAHFNVYYPAPPCNARINDSPQSAMESGAAPQWRPRDGYPVYGGGHSEAFVRRSLFFCYVARRMPRARRPRPLPRTGLGAIRGVRLGAFWLRAIRRRVCARWQFCRCMKPRFLNGFLLGTVTNRSWCRCLLALMESWCLES